MQLSNHTPGFLLLPTASVSIQERSFEAFIVASLLRSEPAPSGQTACTGDGTATLPMSARLGGVSWNADRGGRPSLRLVRLLVTIQAMSTHHAPSVLCAPRKLTARRHRRRFRVSSDPPLRLVLAETAQGAALMRQFGARLATPEQVVSAFGHLRPAHVLRQVLSPVDALPCLFVLPEEVQPW